MMKRDHEVDRGRPARLSDVGRRVRPGRPRSGAGFTLVEVLFAIAILGVGIVGILTLFVSGINMAGWAGSRSQASMEAQSLYAQILSYCSPQPGLTTKRGYIEVMRDEFYPSNKWGGASGDLHISKWLHAYNFSSPSASYTSDAYKNPVPISAGHDYYWQCRASNYMMNKDDPMDPSKDETDSTKNPINPPGLVEIALAIHKQWKPGKESLAVYTTLLSLESK